MRRLVRYGLMFADRVRWYALIVAARIAYVVLIAGGAVVGFAIGAIATLAAFALAIFSLVAMIVGLLRVMGAYRDPLHMMLDVAILSVAGLAVLFAIPMLLGLRAVTRR